MNLADQLHQLADDADTRLLHSAEEVRRHGDKLRRRQRTRLSVGAAVLSLVALAGAITVVSHRGTSSAPGPVSPIDGWRVAQTMEVPGSGALFYADDSLWVVDMKGQQLTDDGAAPAGKLHQFDPASGAAVDTIPGAVGGWPSVGGGALWLCTAAGGLDVLTRVDLATHQVRQIATSHPRQLPHGVAVAGGNLWVANTVSGDVVMVDPTTYRPRRTIHLGDYRDGLAPQSLIGRGDSLWVGNDDGLVSRLDGATGEQSSQLQLPIREVRFDGIDAPHHLLYAHALRGNSLFEIRTGRAGADRLGRELPLTPHRGDGMIAAFAVGSGSLWAATLNPDQLVRIDPETFKVVDRMPLSGLDHGSNVPVALAAHDRAVWIRTNGKVLQLSSVS